MAGDTRKGVGESWSAALNEFTPFFGILIINIHVLLSSLLSSSPCSSASSFLQTT